ncbi:prepilin-type N-terminal cleavage/methylation domain-containing protein [Acetobacteraceae bacterium KSS8]|uniref:Prepilin-type N-terminal cleavage/methylation domain-containing protein n=1 Tax=Endosaccharibacter trunci TaxID=2812733 RepID=A0ABT1WBY8_9PROT|nr:prepilin-type N-terminal cleavage/methylation domain-containing protein [Acetobacteraceae bacterium KSS8]
MFPRASRTPPSAAHPSAQAGFTLLEVLVAFVIAALALGALFGGALGGLRAEHTADRMQEALSRARSHLATVGHGVALRPATEEGEDGSGFRWRIAITPAETSAAQTGAASATRLALYHVVVTEFWPQEGGERSIVLRTERLGTAAGGGP